MLLAQLLAEPVYSEIHALVRRPLPVPASADTNKLIQHIVDYADPGITQALLDSDARGFPVSRPTALQLGLARPKGPRLSVVILALMLHGQDRYRIQFRLEPV